MNDKNLCADYIELRYYKQDTAPKNKSNVFIHLFDIENSADRQQSFYPSLKVEAVNLHLQYIFLGLCPLSDANKFYYIEIEIEIQRKMAKKGREDGRLNYAEDR